MAGPKGDINANVGININDGGITKVFADLEGKIDAALGKIIRLGDVSAGAGGKLTKAAQKELANIDLQLKTLQRGMQSIDTLTKAMNRGSKNNVAGVLGTGLDDAKIAKNVRAVNEFKRSLDEAATPAEKLRARINAITTETANLAREGKAQTDGRLRQQEQLSSSLRQYETLQTRLAASTAKIGALNPQSQKQIEGMVLKAQELNRVFNDLAGDGRRYNFNFLTESMKSLTADIDKQVAGLAAQEKLEERLVVNTRARAQALLDITQRERQISLEQRSASAVSRLTPSQTSFGSAVGEQGLTDRLTRATSAYSSAKRQLESALASGSNASEGQIAKLVRQMEFFDKKIVETIALQGRAARDNLTFSRQEEAAIDRVTAAQERLRRVNQQISFREVSRGIKDSEDALKKFQKELDGIGKGTEKLSPLKKAFDGLLGDGGAGLIARVGIYSLAAGAIYNVIGAFKDGAKFAVEFEDKLATLQAISGSTKTQMADMSAAILNVGKNSRFSIIEITEATTQLAQAGFTVGQTKDALQSVSDFAAASGTSVKESVDLITGALGAFQLQASETSRVTDIFTAALNRSKLTSQQIAQAIQYVGTTAYEQNVSLETLVATIGAVAQSGVRAGSTLGTGFRQFLVDLANPTENLKGELTKLGLTLGDVDVKSRGLNTVLKTLKDAGFGAAQAYAGLEVRAAAFFLAAKNNLDVSQRLELAESQRGVAAEAAARAMDSLSAQTQRFYNILGQLAIDTAPLEFFKDLVKSAADLAEKIGATSTELAKLQETQERGQAPGFIQDLQTRAELFFKQANEVQNLETALYKLATTGSIYTKTAAEQGAASEALATKTANAADASAQQASKIQEVQGELSKLLLQGPDIRNDSIQTSITTNNLTSRFEGLASQLGTTANGYDNLVLAMKRYNAQQLAILGSKAAGEAAAGKNQFTALSQQANGQIASLRQGAGYRALSGAQRSQLEGLIQNQGKPGGLNAINDFVAQVKLAGPALTDLRTRTNGLVSTLANRQATLTQVGAATRVAQDANIQANPIYQGVSTALMEINGTIGKALTAGAGQSAAERKAQFTPILGNLDKYIGRVDNLLAANKGNTSATRNLLNLRGELLSARNQAVGAAKPSDKENKASERAGKKAAAAEKATERAAQRAQDTFNKNELTVSQGQLKAADKALGAFLGGQGQNFGLNDITKLFSDGDKALKDWITARRAVLADAIEKSGLNKEQAADLTEAANTEIEAKQKATIQRQVEILDRAVSSSIERMTKRIENQYKNNLDPAVSSLGRESGLRTGLDNPLLRGVPGYTKILQQRNVDVAQDKLNRAQIGTQGKDGLFSGGENENRINEYNLQIDKLVDSYENLKEAIAQADPEKDKAKVAGYKEEMVRLGDTISEQKDKVLGLYQANESLRAQYSSASLKPQTFGDAASQAAEAFRIENDIGITLKERLFGGLGETLNSLHGSFSTFFQDLVTGSKSVGAAFGDMASAVVKAILNMAAQAVATQIFGLLLSFIPGASPAGGVSASQGLSGFQFRAPGLFNGGRVGDKSPQRLVGGGSVNGGVSTRDSVLVHAAKGEFMMKNSSVESIGHDLLQDMNNRGAAALSKLGGNNVVVPQSQFMSNVYVQLPEEKTQLGPNDVLAIVSRDVLRNGATKQLIKQVASGG